MNIKCHGFTPRFWGIYRCLQIMNRDKELRMMMRRWLEKVTHLTLLSRPVCSSSCSLWQDCQVCQEDPPEPLLSTNQRARPKQGGLWLVGWSTGGKQLQEQEDQSMEGEGNPGNQVVGSEEGGKGELVVLSLSTTTIALSSVQIYLSVKRQHNIRREWNMNVLFRNRESIVEQRSVAGRNWKVTKRWMMWVRCVPQWVHSVWLHCDIE